jgi:hypothetical protein
MISLRTSQCTIGEELPMTMQVGMVGAGGVVVASDTRWNRSLNSSDNVVRNSYGASKIWFDGTRRIAVAGAMDMVASRRVADGIFSASLNAGEERCAERIREIGIQAAKRSDTECLIVFADPKPTLYHFQYAKNNEASFCERIITYIHTGDRINPAVFWAENYHTVELSIEQLSRLGSHVVVTAGALNSGGVSGLEVVSCDGSGLHRLTDEENREREVRALEWDKTIGELIMGRP